MSDEPQQKTWFERLSHILTREPKDRAELIELLQDAQQRDLLELEALRMIEGVLQVFDMQVRDIMVPRSQMVVIEHDATFQEILPIVVSSAHSRFPVLGNSRDEVIGILLAKDLLDYDLNKTDNFDIQAKLRPVTFIPESKRLNILLEEFRLKRNHIAIVIDEYGGISGMLTIEDVLEQIVGNIEDEYDTDENQIDITPLADNVFIIKASLKIADFNTYFHTNFSDDEFDTIGGLVTHSFGRLPKRDESIDIGTINFKVQHADKRRIRLLRVTRNEAV